MSLLTGEWISVTQGEYDRMKSEREFFRRALICLLIRSGESLKIQESTMDILSDRELMIDRLPMDYSYELRVRPLPAPTSTTTTT